MDHSLRKRNASDGDSGFDSALSSRSSSICLEESSELHDFKISKVEESHTPPAKAETPSELYSKFADILDKNEDIFKDESTEGLFIIRDSNTGRETQYKPPGRIRFDSREPRVEETYSKADYDRAVSVSRAHLFNSRLQLELEKQVAQMQLLEIDLLMDRTQVPPPSLGIRIIGVNMIHGVPDKLNIYVKKVMAESVAGRDARIRVDDHIVEVNGVSLVGVSQKLAADTLSSCMVNPETGVVHFVLARAPEPEVQEADTSSEQKMADTSKSVAVPAETIKPTKVDDLPSVPNVDGLLGAAAATAAVSTSASCNMIVSRGGPLHSGTSEAFIPCTSISASAGQTTPASPFSSTSSKMASSDAGNSDLVVAAAGGDDDAPSHNHNGMAAVAKTAANLSDLPVTVLLRVACYLADPVDRGSLAVAINKSFLSSGVLDDDGCSDTSRHLVDGGKSVKLSSLVLTASRRLM
jgi:hypothetical protein